MIKKRRLQDAIAILTNTNKKGAGILKMVIRSAASNASRIQEKTFKEEDLYVSRILIDMGPSLKRYRSMSMGRAGLIRKRTSHVLIELDAPKVTVGKASARQAKVSRNKSTAKTGKK